MKRLFLLIAVCVFGMVLPQVVCADTYTADDVEIVVNGKTVTVNSTKAGALSTYLNSSNASAAIAAIQAANGEGSSIVFDGKFNGDDLSALNSKSCCVQKKVDMAEAKFIKSGSSGGGSSYPYLYHNETVMNNNTSGKNEGDRCITGGKKYTSGSSDGGHNFNWIDQTGQNNDYTDNNQLNSLGGNDPQWYSTLEEAGSAPYNDYNTAILVGGKEYVFHNGSWVEDTQSGGDDDEYDYTQMTFGNWKNTVEEIITSKYAEGQMASQLCSDCTQLKKITLSAGDFALMSNGSASTLGNNLNNLQEVNIKADVTTLTPSMFSGMTSITTVNFEDGDKNLTIGESCFDGCTGITSLTIPARLSSMGKRAFAGTKGVSSLSLPANSRLTVIPGQAFYQCGNNTEAAFDITIPRSVTEIQKQAFGDMARLNKVRFTGQKGDPDLIIRDEAFAGGDGSEDNSTLSDVYVDINPDDRKLICEYHAFGYVPMEGQTSVENLSQLATLHFNEDYWDYYAGNWKKGITFDQNALNSFKDGCNTSTGFPKSDQSMIGTNQQIHESDGKIPDKSPANGWQQFAKTDTGIDIIVPVGKFYRTFSTPSALVKPDWMKIYRVKQFDDGFKKNSNASSADEANAATKQAFTEELTPTVTGSDKKTYNIIPLNTGVIRVDVRETEAIYYFLELERTSAASAYNENLECPYSETGDKVNYMYPTKGDEVTIGPTEKSGNTITYRIFGLLKTTTSGVVPQFSRAKVGTKLGDHRAYLRLPADVFHWRDEKNGSSQDATGNDVVVDTRANAYSKISLFFDEDIEELGSGIATAIINSIEEDMYKNDSFYTLQGVKVAKPTTKGVYIHNGKKILIK